MANPYPLQPGDRSSNYSGSDSSTSADRRPASDNPVRPEGGTHSAPQAEAPMGDLWRAGSLAPTYRLPEPVHCVGDNAGAPDEVHEININVYGDCYDPEAPMRVRVVRDWTFDPDNDGKVS